MALTVAFGIALILAWAGLNLAVARWALRCGLCALIGGLLGYNYFALKFPGSQDLLKTYGTPGVIVITLLTALGGGVIGWIWQRLSIRKQPPQRVTGPTSLED